MINRVKATQTKLTDFNVGAVARTLLEAPASEIDELYQQMFNGLQQAIPTAVYTSFQFPALAANAASGLVRVTIAAQAADELIAGGSQFTSTSTGVVLASNADVVIRAGQTYADVPVTATTTGSASNVVQNTSFTLAPSINGFVSAVNLSALVNGRDAETDAERLIRFNNYISTLQRGTVAAIGYGLSTVQLTDATGNVTEQVIYAQVVEPYLTDNTQPIALVNAYIHNGVGGTSSALVTQAQKIIAGYTNPDGSKVPGWKAAGIPCNIYPATEEPLNVTGKLAVAPGYVYATVEAQVQSAIFTYLQSLPISATAQDASITQIVMNIPGVSNFILQSPTGDTTAAVGTKIMPGAITINPA